MVFPKLKHKAFQTNKLCDCLEITTHTNFHFELRKPVYCDLQLNKSALSNSMENQAAASSSFYYWKLRNTVNNCHIYQVEFCHVGVYRAKSPAFFLLHFNNTRDSLYGTVHQQRDGSVIRWTNTSFQQPAAGMCQRAFHVVLDIYDWRKHLSLCNLPRICIKCTSEFSRSFQRNREIGFNFQKSFPLKTN